MLLYLMGFILYPGVYKMELQIKRTKNYEIFSYLKENRDVNPLHIERIKQSMEKKTLINIVITNEHHQIIDGQHRYEALKDLNKEILYIIVPGYGENEIQIYNENQINWTNMDFLNFYVTKENKNYQYLKSYKDTNKLSLSISILFSSGKTYRGQAKDLLAFKTGRYIFNSLGAQDVAKRYNLIKNNVPDIALHISFASAFYQAIITPGADWERMYSAFRNHNEKLIRRGNKAEYLKDIQKIYNYGLQVKNKVRFYNDL